MAASIVIFKGQQIEGKIVKSVKYVTGGANGKIKTEAWIMTECGNKIIREV